MVRPARKFRKDLQRTPEEEDDDEPEPPPGGRGTADPQTRGGRVRYVEILDVPPGFAPHDAHAQSPLLPVRIDLGFFIG